MVMQQQQQRQENTREEDKIWSTDPDREAVAVCKEGAERKCRTRARVRKGNEKTRKNKTRIDEHETTVRCNSRLRSFRHRISSSRLFLHFVTLELPVLVLFLLLVLLLLLLLLLLVLLHAAPNFSHRLSSLVASFACTNNISVV